MPHDSTAPDHSKDKFLLTLNADEEYSMLRCPGKYTLAVKEYLGDPKRAQYLADFNNLPKLNRIKSSKKYFI